MSEATMHAALVQGVILPLIAIGLMLLSRYGLKLLRWACRKMQQRQEPTPTLVENEIIIERLQEATRAAKRIRGRVSFLSALILVQGMAMLCLSELSFIWREAIGFHVEEGEDGGIAATWLSKGKLPWWEDGTVPMVIAPWAIGLGALAIRPVDGESARGANNWAFVFAFEIVLTFTAFIINVQGDDEALIGAWPYITMQSLTLAVIVYLVPSTSLGCCGPCCLNKSRLCRWCSYWWDVSTPRQRLRRFWQVLRLFAFLYGLNDAVMGIYIAFLNEGINPEWAPVTALSMSFILFSLTMTPYVRGMAIRRIDSTLARLLAPRDRGELEHGREMDAAAISALMDNKMDAADVYVAAKRKFCALPLALLTRAMMKRRPNEREMHKHRSVSKDTSKDTDGVSFNDEETSYTESRIGRDPAEDDTTANTSTSSVSFFDHFAVKCTVSAVLGEVDAFLTYSCESAVNHAQNHPLRLRPLPF
jgi:hypothetical protein